jgi:hypothetical protein
LSVDAKVQQTLEAYLYAGDDPVNGSDPGGTTAIVGTEYKSPDMRCRVECGSGLGEIDGLVTSALRDAARHFGGALRDIRVISAVVQVGADIVAIGAAAAGFEPVAIVALGVAQTAGFVNVAATCAEGNVGNCVSDAALTFTAMKMARLFAPGTQYVQGVVLSSADQAVRGGTDLVVTVIGWALGTKAPSPLASKYPKMYAVTRH